jgi:transcriptional regulator with XRE-family HTH domain
MAEERVAAGDPVALGLAVRARRLGIGWTQQQLASHAGVSLATIRNIESGAQARYRALTRHGLCRALGWPADALESLAQDGEPDLPASHDDVELLAAFGGTLARLTDAERSQVLEFARRLAEGSNHAGGEAGGEA